MHPEEVRQMQRDLLNLHLKVDRLNRNLDSMTTDIGGGKFSAHLDKLERGVQALMKEVGLNQGRNISLREQLDKMIIPHFR